MEIHIKQGNELMWLLKMGLEVCRNQTFIFPWISGSVDAWSLSVATLQTVTAMARETWLNTWDVLFRGLHFASQYTVNVFSGHFII